MKIDDSKPILTFVDKTEKLLQDQEYTYNDVRLTYNSDVSYGGIYGKEGQGPTMNIYDYKPL
jgi:hypothetical protein